MPRYHFNVHGKSDLPDEAGRDFPDLDAARSDAVRLAGALIRDHGAKFAAGERWTMDVTDNKGLMLFSLHFTAADVPAADHLDDRSGS